MSQCDICRRSFARNEHLIRHLRTHTGERPFQCPHCSAGFHRADVRAKHMKTIHPEVGSVSGSSASLPQHTGAVKGDKPRDRARSRLACDQCRKRKLKCDNVRPCEACRSKNVPCTVSSSSRPPGRPRNVVPVSGSPGDRPIHADGESDSGVPLAPQAWTPNSPESPLATPSLMPSLAGMVMSAIGDGGDAYRGATGLTPPAVDQWMTSESPSNFSIESIFSSESIPMYEISGSIDLMDSLLPQLNPGSWLDDLNELPLMDHTWPADPLEPSMDSDPSMDNAVDMMAAHLQRRSRAPSPSREEQKRSWYSMPPTLHVYDEDVINILLNLSRTHISSTFAIFSDFEANSDTRVELWLAMGAVGGLYCTAYAGINVAKMLFNDSRRLLLEQYLQEDSMSFDTSLSFAKTFILLEIYGLCSGDKRAYEFIEVFHGSKLDAVSCCLHALPPSAPLDQHRQTKLLSEAMRVLDSYRVLLLRLPPSFAGEDPLDPHVASGMMEFQSLPTGGLVSTPSCSRPVDPPTMDHLVTIICYSWMASPQNTENSSYPPLWKREFVELALNRWMHAKTTGTETPRPPEVPQMLLFHLTQVSLHSNLSHLQRLSPAAVQATASSRNRDVLDSVRAWRNGHHFNIAHWHAKSILSIAQEEMAPLRRRGSSEEDRVRFVEAPHLPLCIYFATLVVWYGEATSEDRGKGSAHTSPLEVGSQLLFRLRVPVSKLLGTLLCEFSAGS